MLSAMVVLPSAIFAIFRSSQVSAFGSDAILLSMGVTAMKRTGGSERVGHSLPLHSENIL